MNTLPVVPQLSVLSGRPVTTSLNVAEVFGKQHDNVLRTIARLKNEVCSIDREGGERNFALTSYLDSNNRLRPMCQITRDGFTLLAMGFTGKEAMRFKLAYIEAFNRMEAELLGLAGGGERKTVKVDHTHSKTSNAPGGLDIRYTMDLGKIVANPTRRSIELLERLTGIQLTDITMRDETATDISIAEVMEFYRLRCRFVSGEKETFAKVYAAYRDYSLGLGSAPAMVASKKRFSSLLGACGFTVAKMSGSAYLLDMRLIEEVVQ